MTWLIHIYETIHSHLWHTSSICVTRFNLMCDMSLISPQRAKGLWRQTPRSPPTSPWMPTAHHRRARPPRAQAPIHICECVISQIEMSHATHLNESCHTSEWVMAHTWMSHVQHTRCNFMNESCHTCEWVMPHMWMSHVTHMKYNAGIRCWGSVLMSNVKLMSNIQMNHARFTSRPEARGSGVEAVFRFLGSGVDSRGKKGRKGSEGRELGSGVRLQRKTSPM